MSLRHLITLWKVDEALRHHAGLSVTLDDTAALVLAGNLSFTASAEGLEVISDSYEIAISIPEGFPLACPRVRDTGTRIAKNYHRLTDGSFCLGSPARLRLLLAESPTISGFISKCVIPYLYGYSFFEKHGHPPFGELTHGDRGIIEDYQRLLRMPSTEACASMLMLIGQKRRIANKQQCPCGSGKRLGRCHNRTANRLRSKLGRRWCRGEERWLYEDYVGIEPKALLRDALALARRQSKDPNRRPAEAPASSEAAIKEKAVA